MNIRKYFLLHWGQIGCGTESLKGGKNSQAFLTELSKTTEQTYCENHCLKERSYNCPGGDE